MAAVAYAPRADVVQGLRQPRPARLARVTRASAEGDQAPLDPTAAALAVADLGHRAVGSARVRGFLDAVTLQPAHRLEL